MLPEPLIRQKEPNPIVSLNESTVEDAALSWFSDLGYAVGHGPDISPSGETLTSALTQRERVAAGWRCRGGRLERRLRP